MMVRVKIPQGVLTRAAASRARRCRGALLHRPRPPHHAPERAVPLRPPRERRGARGCSRTPGSPRARLAATPSATSPPASTPAPPRWSRSTARPTRKPLPATSCADPLSSSLPRKFKIAFGGCCGTDCVGASFNDVGLPRARAATASPGFRVTLAGGLSTLRRAGILAHEFAPAEEVIEICEAVVRVFNRTGDRQHRHQRPAQVRDRQAGAGGVPRQYLEEREQVRQPRPVSLPRRPAARSRAIPRAPPQPGLRGVRSHQCAGAARSRSWSP